MREQKGNGRMEKEGKGQGERRTATDNIKWEEHLETKSDLDDLGKQKR